MQRQPRKRPKVITAQAGLALMRVDGRKIREKIKREYEKLVRDLRQAREQVDRFQNENLPGFSRWVNSRFGALLTEIRETTQRLSTLQGLFLEMETEILLSGISPGQAYARVKEQREQVKAPGEESPESEEDPRKTHSSRSRQTAEDGDSKFDDFFGFGKENKPGTAAHPLSSAVAHRLKELYRALARRLHPDAQKDMTPQKREWWHQAQGAYEKGDVEQLEIILSLSEIEDTGTTEKTSLSALQRISGTLKKSLRQLKAQTARHRRDPAWDFDPKGDNEVLASTMRRQLNHELRSLKVELAGMESQVAAWTAQSVRRRSPRPRRRAISDPFEFFF